MKTLPEKIIVLYVEDDPLTRQSVSNRFSRHGVEVLAAESGEGALALVHEHPRLAAVLLDLQLPGMDGVETCTRLLNLYPHLPVVVCSADLDGPMQERLLAMGIPEQCQLRKPCPFRELLAAVIRVARAG
jgi:CheY-like chemotaxis protein